jgi:hypothetical protein
MREEKINIITWLCYLLVFGVVCCFMISVFLKNGVTYGELKNFVFYSSIGFSCLFLINVIHSVFDGGLFSTAIIVLLAVILIICVSIFTYYAYYFSLYIRPVIDHFLSIFSL